MDNKILDSYEYEHMKDVVRNFVGQDIEYQGKSYKLRMIAMSPSECVLEDCQSQTYIHLSIKEIYNIVKNND